MTSQPSNDTRDYGRLFLSSVPLMDVRAPLEFCRGAFPTAVNLPLMNDKERHAVGLRYKQAGQEKAIQLGEQLVAGELRELRIAQWEQHCEQHPEGFLYCFRGGLRSRTVQRWLRERGVDYPLVQGGYKAMRSYLLQTLADCSSSLQFILLAGRTGSGKTVLLKHLPSPVDLEGLAQHRGSSFGATLTPQPSNIDFENSIAIELLRYRQQQAQAIFLEDEGRMIGRACVPESLRATMQTAPAVILDTSMEERIDISLEAYITELLAMYQAKHGESQGFECFADHHRNSLQRIVRRFGQQRCQQALTLFNQALEVHRGRGDLSGYRSYIHLLLSEYYDPMYDYQIRTKQRKVLFRGAANDVLDWAQTRMKASLETEALQP